MSSECPGDRRTSIAKDATVNVLKVATPPPGPSLRAPQPPGVAVTIATATTAQKGIGCSSSSLTSVIK